MSNLYNIKTGSVIIFYVLDRCSTTYDHRVWMQQKEKCNWLKSNRKLIKYVKQEKKNKMKCMKPRKPFFKNQTLIKASASQRESRNQKPNPIYQFDEVGGLEILFEEVITQPLDDHVALSWCHGLFIDPKHT